MIQVKCIGKYLVEFVNKEKDAIVRKYTSRSLRKIVKIKLENEFNFFLHYLSIIIAILFMIGSSCFVGASALLLYPSLDIDIINIGVLYFIGSLFFTSASYLQYLQVINADITNKLHTSSQKREWIWFAYRGRNLGFLSSFVQFIGTILFNFNTYDAMLKSMSFLQDEIFISIPNMLGSICFMLASLFAWLEVYHDKQMKKFTSVLWWIIWLNILGSILFQLSAIYAFSFNAHDSHFQEIATYFTMFGGLAFLIASYLLIPETQQKEKYAQVQ